MSKEYEEVDLEAIYKENDELLALFEESLQNLKPATIRRHLNNVGFFLDDYAADYEGDHYKEAIDDIYRFLGDFFIRKCMWSTPASIKSTAASLKKFYKCMMDAGKIDKDDYEEVCFIIKENMDEWQYTCEIYNDPDQPNPFMFF